MLEQPSGGTEVGKYFLAGWASAANDIMSQYMTSTSRTSVPASVTVDEADQAHSTCNAVGNANLSANGVQIFTTATGAVANAMKVAGNLTFNY